MGKILIRIRNSFHGELREEGDVWRILRKGTLVDLITLSFFYYKNEKDDKYLIDLFNYCMKIKLLVKIKAIEVKGNLNEILMRFNKEHGFVLNQYDSILHELQSSFDMYESATHYDLSEKIRYIQVVNELEIDSYADDVFDEIMGITFSILNETKQ